MATARLAMLRRFPGRLPRKWRHAGRSSRRARRAKLSRSLLMESASGAENLLAVVWKVACGLIWIQMRCSAAPVRQAAKLAAPKMARWQRGVQNIQQQSSACQDFVWNVSSRCLTVFIAGRLVICRATLVLEPTRDAARDLRCAPSVTTRWSPPGVARNASSADKKKLAGLHFVQEHGGSARDKVLSSL